MLTYTQIPNKFFEYLKENQITVKEFTFLCLIAKWDNTPTGLKASISYICKAIHIKRNTAVQMKKDLVAKNLITITNTNQFKLSKKEINMNPKANKQADQLINSSIVEMDPELKRALEAAKKENFPEKDPDLLDLSDFKFADDEEETAVVSTDKNIEADLDDMFKKTDVKELEKKVDEEHKLNSKVANYAEDRLESFPAAYNQARGLSEKSELVYDFFNELMTRGCSRNASKAWKAELYKLDLLPPDGIIKKFFCKDGSSLREKKDDLKQETNAMIERIWLELFHSSDEEYNEIKRYEELRKDHNLVSGSMSAKEYRLQRRHVDSYPSITREQLDEMTRIRDEVVNG